MPYQGIHTLFSTLRKHKKGFSTKINVTPIRAGGSFVFNQMAPKVMTFPRILYLVEFVLVFVDVFMVTIKILTVNHERLKLFLECLLFSDQSDSRRNRSKPQE